MPHNGFHAEQNSSVPVLFADNQESQFTPMEKKFETMDLATSDQLGVAVEVIKQLHV